MQIGVNKAPDRKECT